MGEHGNKGDDLGDEQYWPEIYNSLTSKTKFHVHISLIESAFPGFPKSMRLLLQLQLSPLLFAFHLHFKALVPSISSSSHIFTNSLTP